jgi:DNA recombination protein RmuC
MTELTVGIAVLAGAIVVLLLIQLARSLRQERAVRDELARVSLALAQSQRDALAQVSGQLTSVVADFYRQLGEFGQQVQGVKTTTEEALRQGQQGVIKVFGDLRGQLGQVAEMATRMEALGREIDELQGILKAPKLRGQMGEWQLEEFLRQVLPPGFFELQYRFADGQAVDAVIKLRDHLVPVDAKFPLESFKRLLAAEDDTARRTARKEFERSVKGRIDEIAKYIRPGEGTFEFALMFIPAENVYYEAFVREGVSADERSLLNDAIARRVVPVSPNSFYAYLLTIATGLKGMQVEAQAREILNELARLQTDFGRLSEVFRLVGTHIGNAQKKYEEAERLAGKFEDRLQSVTEREPEAPLPGGDAPPLPDKT